MTYSSGSNTGFSDRETDREAMRSRTENDPVLRFFFCRAATVFLFAAHGVLFTAALVLAIGRANGSVGYHDTGNQVRTGEFIQYHGE